MQHIYELLNDLNKADDGHIAIFATSCHEAIDNKTINTTEQ
ncbi:hypothetical protein HMPREF9136_1433 [Prevotella dentalis DSM 3688]|uniref:Uncharacterized protein n=1 Tax=Prevotella dentalis (strain ATCC 49559 / DSM 3688 / JCM 13448 / NCTC 12043 / ES 2772) TaxID=908937 RepID=F9D3K5_PREDD|nr:hypothetical protein HMPREF9136_1433 [Prevotella dentalis DSM 3688]